MCLELKSLDTYNDPFSSEEWDERGVTIIEVSKMKAIGC